jgi:hypothetical protein
MTRKFRTREERAHLLEQWKLSGKKAKQWCREQGITYSTFSSWENAGKIINSIKTIADSFVEIQEESSNKTGIELDVQGVLIRVSKNFDVATLQKCLLLLKEV